MSNTELIIKERAADIGNFLVGRLLPFRQKRAVGPFTFIDHMGPAKMGRGENLDVAAHPHIGLSTLTYLFEGSFMSAWCKINDIEVVRVKPNLHRSTQQVKDYIRDCIDVIVTPSIKSIENYSYSQTWWGNSAVESVVDKVRKAITSCVTSTQSKTDDILITCPKANWCSEDKVFDSDFVSETGRIKKRPIIKGKGFTRADWLYSDARATNDYSHKTMLIYLIGKNPNTVLWNFCNSKGVAISKDLYATASMVQWIFRGSVRRKEKMYLVMPSKEMRDLYFKWLSTDDENLK